MPGFIIPVPAQPEVSAHPPWNASGSGNPTLARSRAAHTCSHYSIPACCNPVPEQRQSGLSTLTYRAVAPGRLAPTRARGGSSCPRGPPGRSPVKGVAVSRAHPGSLISQHSPRRRMLGLTVGSALLREDGRTQDCPPTCRSRRAWTQCPLP